jgi:hypothetical protein
VAPPEPYRSWLEADVAHDLEKKGVEFEYETLKIPFVEPAKVRTYIPDIKIKSLIVEVKGRWTAVDRRKMGYVIEQNPDKDIRMLFHKDNTISRNSRTRYSTWCKKRNIKYAIGDAVPDEWLEEVKDVECDD